MDLIKKLELLLNAKTRSVLPGGERRSPLAEEEAELLAEVRRALGEVEAQERKLANRLKMERVEAQAAENRGDRREQQAHERRAAELEQRLETESIQAIDLEQKLAALEEKLALAREAVEKEGRKAAEIDAEAERVLSQGAQPEERTQSLFNQAPAPQIPDLKVDDDTSLDQRKSRLSD